MKEVSLRPKVFISQSFVNFYIKVGPGRLWARCYNLYNLSVDVENGKSSRLGGCNLKLQYICIVATYQAASNNFIIFFSGTVMNKKNINVLISVKCIFIQK